MLLLMHSEKLQQAKDRKKHIVKLLFSNA